MNNRDRDLLGYINQLQVLNLIPEDEVLVRIEADNNVSTHRLWPTNEADCLVLGLMEVHVETSKIEKRDGNLVVIERHYEMCMEGDTGYGLYLTSEEITFTRVQIPRS